MDGKATHEQECCDLLKVQRGFLMGELPDLLPQATWISAPW